MWSKTKKINLCLNKYTSRLNKLGGESFLFSSTPNINAIDLSGDL